MTKHHGEQNGDNQPQFVFSASFYPTEKDEQGGLEGGKGMVSLLVAAPEVKAGDLSVFAQHEVPVGTGLARVAVVAVPADADDGALLESLGCGVAPSFHDLFGLTTVSRRSARACGGSWYFYPSYIEIR